jgi:hypothetical protein
MGRAASFVGDVTQRAAVDRRVLDWRPVRTDIGTRVLRTAAMSGRLVVWCARTPYWVCPIWLGLRWRASTAP